jgi:cell fate regulator YaaT (PSP1 superfamily)
MCCLMYEHRTYVEARRRFPREGKILRTPKGEERVVAVDICRDTVTLRNSEGMSRSVTLDTLRQEVSSFPGQGAAETSTGDRSVEGEEDRS